MSRTSVRKSRRPTFRCEACGATASQWLGRCPECGGWGSIAEVPASLHEAAVGLSESAPVPVLELVRGHEVRFESGIAELDRTLGGGLVAGSVTLLAGEPGTGKSTLALQALAGYARRDSQCLLVSGEESVVQVRARAERLDALSPRLMLAADTALPALLSHVESTRPQVVLVDSIQTLSDEGATGSPGSVSQVRHCATELVRVAKRSGVAVVLVGHVTKDGSVAGPRVLEHVVDTVLALEGDRHHGLRMLRLLKHRFGPTDELGLFEMTAAGLEALADPSRFFLADRRSSTPGSVVGAALESGRTLLVEVQALVADSMGAVPRRTGQGLDSARLDVLLAVLDQRAGVSVGRGDVYASVAGGMRVGGPDLDLAVVLAIVSAARAVPLPDHLVAVGEVGLGGELRQVPNIERRLAEAVKLGFRSAVVPSSCPEVAGLSLVRAPDLLAALGALGLVAKT